MLEKCDEHFAELEKTYNNLHRNVAELAGQRRIMESNIEKFDFETIQSRRKKYESTSLWNEAQSLTAEGYEKLKLLISFNKNKLTALQTKCADYRETLARNSGASPAEISEQIELLKNRLNEKKLCYDAVMLAKETLDVSGDRLRENLMPRLIETASGAFSKSTGGKYNNLGIDGDLYMTYSHENRTHSTDYLSGGSLDAAYISLRFALASVIYKKAVPPLIFDESFSKIDEERSDRLLNFLSGEKSQVIVFTCRSGDCCNAAKKLNLKSPVILL